jgi:D-aminopeptidase
MATARRARDFGIPFTGAPGALNAITDVPGIHVGATTLWQGDGALEVGEGPVRTGVTAILPRGHEGVGEPCAAAIHSLNGNGEMTGSHWIRETGSLSGPVMITNTHSVGAVHEGVIRWTIKHRPDLSNQWLLPVVAETWDGYLNDINGLHVRPEHAMAAIDSAETGPPAEGSVGGGTGMNCYAFKAGSGTASRQVQYGSSTYTVGAFLQCNFGSRHELTIAGVPMGDLDIANPMETSGWFVKDGERHPAPAGAGSVIAVIATDAPLLPGQCEAMARRVPMGLARTGTTGGHFSGDVFLAFSTANRGSLRSAFPLTQASDSDYDAFRSIPWGRMDAFLEATAWAVEEAVINALVANLEDVVGRDGHTSPALPISAVVERLRSAGRITA